MIARTQITQPQPLRTTVTARGRSVNVTPSRQTIAVTQITTGLTGKPGAGAPAGTGDLSYTHQQAQASDAWAITHALGKRPAVTVVDSAGDVVEGDVVYIDANSLQITFSSAFAGLAFLN